MKELLNLAQVSVLKVMAEVSYKIPRTYYTANDLRHARLDMTYVDPLDEAIDSPYELTF